MSDQPLESHGIVGDLHSVALVGMDGSIDMMPFPRFDAPSICNLSTSTAYVPGT